MFGPEIGAREAASLPNSLPVMGRRSGVIKSLSVMSALSTEGETTMPPHHSVRSHRGRDGFSYTIASVQPAWLVSEVRASSASINAGTLPVEYVPDIAFFTSVVTSAL